jgi:hypothetical protein
MLLLFFQVQALVLSFYEVVVESDDVGKKSFPVVCFIKLLLNFSTTDLKLGNNLSLQIGKVKSNWRREMVAQEMLTLTANEVKSLMSTSDRSVVDTSNPEALLKR